MPSPILAAFELTVLEVFIAGGRAAFELCCHVEPLFMRG
jgi:hypothetical protein